MFITSKTGFRPVSAIFIDVPNATKRRDPRNFDWDCLTKEILKNNDLRNTDVIHAGAYARNRDRATLVSGWIERTFKRFAENLSYATALSEVWVTARHDRDVDSLIINDLWSVVAHHKEFMHKRHGAMNGKLQVRILLVSGDNDYESTLNDLRRIYEEHIEFEIVVYSWEESLGGKLASLADKVRFLEAMEGFVKKTGTAVL